MTKPIGKLNKCTDCNGTGYIITLRKITLIVSFATDQEPRLDPFNTEAEQTLLYKLAWDLLMAKQKDGITDLQKF